MSTMTQLQMYREAERTSAIVNQDFLWLVKEGMTREDLQSCIKKRPALWTRFEQWVDKLPSREQGAA